MWGCGGMTTDKKDKHPPIRISDPFNRSPHEPEQSLLTMTTAPTGRGDPRSTLHHGLFSVLVWVQLF